MEEKYQLKEGCLTIQMPKELDHHEAGRLKLEADYLIGAYHVRRLVFDFRPSLQRRGRDFGLSASSFSTG